MNHSICNSGIHLLRTLSSLVLTFSIISISLAQDTFTNEGPEKFSGFRLNVAGSDALIYGLTVGRGSGSMISNTAFGFSALFSNTTGANNTAMGYEALFSNTTGYHNSAVGIQSLNANTTGYRNTAIGFETLLHNTIGFHNTASGIHALYSNTTGSNNTASGVAALFSNTSGYQNTASGVNALYSNKEGYHNTAIGSYALFDLNTGTQNTAIGFDAGGFRESITLGTFVGDAAYPSVNDLTNVTGIGHNARPDASNQVRVGNSSVTSIGGHVGWTEISDGFYKTNVSDEVAGLDFVLQLRPVSYNLDVHKLATDLEEDLIRAEDGSKATAIPDEITQKSRDEKAAIRYTGFVAQEVEATVNELGVAFSGVDAPVNKSGHYGLRYSDFVVPLVKAVQEQQVQINALSPEGIDALQSELVALRAENQLMRGQINEIISLLENLGVDVSQSTRQGADDSQQQFPTGNARLEQNTPNPFHENTLIRYFLPEGTNRAQIIITDMGGTQVMALPLEHQGAGQILIHGGTLPSGTFIYTLIVNGRKIDSKRMVLL